MNIPKQYKLINESEIKELGSRSYELIHIKTGAKIFVLENDDPNKVFSIAFRTPVSDSTGVPHILEHSVLCGSDRYPVKDPFMSLAKSSLNTFLNAMTYPDKTVYPVASCNLQDFKNLMSVYMDAVLRPQIYRHREIFMQEGWHYEIEDAAQPLTINGVVYNEMKGAFSDPDEVVDRYAVGSLFPDTTYGFVSGGDPEVIPELTYEQFIDFHSRYYHPSNSYIYLYGDCDMAERLSWLDAEYLSAYDRIEVPSRIAVQEAFAEPRQLTAVYPANDTAKGRGGYISTQWAIDRITDAQLEMAFEVIESVILLNEGAPLKQALLDAGLCEDVLGGYQAYTLQPYFTIVAKGIAEDKREAFTEIVNSTLGQIIKTGLKKRSLYAAINRMEFNLKEWQGSMPRGLNYGLTALDSWLYDADPALFLRFDGLISFLREKAETDYFERLIEKYLINNTHRSTLLVSASTTLAAEREEALAKKLSDYKDSLSPEEIDRLVKDTAAFHSFQLEEDRPEDIARLPKLTLAEISPEIRENSTVPSLIKGTPVLFHETNTYGISYMSLLYELDCVKPEELPLLGLLRNFLEMLDTEHYSYSELSDEIDLRTGGISFSGMTGEELHSGRYFPKLRVGTKFMHGGFEDAFGLINEILYKTDYSDTKRLSDLIRLLNSKNEAAFNGASHTVAYSRAQSYAGGADKYNELTDGIDFVEYVKKLCAANESGLKATGAALRKLAARIFTPENLTVSIIDDAGSYAVICAGLEEKLVQTVHRNPAPGPEFPADNRREAFATAGQVGYSAVAGSFKSAGLVYTGALRVLRSILSNEYFWNSLRVSGGAYGAMCGFSQYGFGYFVSYRDPHLVRTYRVYDEAADYISKLELTEEQMTEYIIGAIGAIDRPLSPFSWGFGSLIAYLSGFSNEERRKERREILTCTPEIIRGLAPYLKAVAGSGCICSIGPASKIEEHRSMFGEVKRLF